MASFQEAYNLVSLAEGGYQRMSEDTGNYNSHNELVGTNWGINAHVYERWIGHPPTTQEMRDMPRATAKAIYRRKYWDRIKGDEIQSQDVANIFFDGHVNHGYTGIKLMQEVLGVTKDGIVGNDTLSAINRTNPAQLYNAYKQRRIEFYHYLVARTPKFKKFLRGWLRRMDRFTDLVKEVVEHAADTVHDTYVDNSGNIKKKNTAATAVAFIILVLFIKKLKKS